MKLLNRKVKFFISENKVGIAKKLVDIFTMRHINILKMEINPPYISFELEGTKESWIDVEKWVLDGVPEIQKIIDLDMLDFERRAVELDTIINSMTVGVVAVNDYGQILYYNTKAESIFNIQKKDLKAHINTILPKKIYNPEVDLKDKSGLEISNEIRGNEIEGILDIRVVRNEEEKKIGALLILREMDEVKELMNTISRPSMNTFDEIIGCSDSIKRTKRLAKSVAKTESSIMILGESGTGKELFARAIHMASNRSKGPFVAVNCSAVPDSLIESEFFGYEKGAFTGASESGKQGLFELAENGSLFLDEIGDLPIHLQAKILRALQEKKIRRVGGDKEIPINVRIISATHRDLKAMVQKKTFREDLYYRLNVVPVQIEPLRERTGDIELLVLSFMKSLGKIMGKENLSISDCALEDLKNHYWPGNVRELQNVMERAVIFADDEIRREHLLIHHDDTKNLDDILEFSGDSDDKPKIVFPVDLPNIINEVEFKYISEANRRFNSSREMAKSLGISHTTVINRLKSYDLHNK